MTRTAMLAFWAAWAGTALGQQQREPPQKGLAPGQGATSAIAPLPAQQPVKGPETRRVQVLLVLDTHDQMGATWGRDGENVKALLEAGFRAQKLDDRVTITRLVGKDVTPETILAHYRTTPIASDEALVFYFSGHGGHHATKGHFLALRYGKLYRNDLLAAMSARNPRLKVLLTDCCANFAGGAFAKEPPNPHVGPLTGKASPATPPARREEPPGANIALLQPFKRPVRPNDRPNPLLALASRGKAKTEEPPATELLLTTDAPRNLKRARREEPPGVADTVAGGASRSLATHTGPLAFDDLLRANDGTVLRDLFFRHVGTVDVNGCATGAFSFGTLDWGGSLFTNTLVALQTTPRTDLDRNANRVVEWTEFFPHLQQRTLDASVRVSRGRFRQAPEAAGPFAAPIAP